MRRNERRATRLPPVQFGILGLAVGAVAGMLAGLAVEIAQGELKAIIMQIGSVAGVTVGFLVESVRFWWRKRKRNEPPRN